MKQKILICGATGFIGRNILESFIGNENFDIRAVYNKSIEIIKNYTDIEWVKADLTNSNDVKRVVKDVDIIL